MAGAEAELEALRKEYEEFTQQSEEVERALEADAAEARAAAEKAERAAEERAAELAKAREALGEADRRAGDLQRLLEEERARAALLRQELTKHETENEKLTHHQRASVYHIENIQHELESTVESQVMASQDIEDQRRAHEEALERLREENRDLRGEVVRWQRQADLAAQQQQQQSGGAWCCMRPRSTTSSNVALVEPLAPEKMDE